MTTSGPKFAQSDTTSYTTGCVFPSMSINHVVQSEFDFCVATYSEYIDAELVPIGMNSGL